VPVLREFWLCPLDSAVLRQTSVPRRVRRTPVDPRPPQPRSEPL